MLIKRDNYIVAVTKREKSRKLGEFPSLLYPASSFKVSFGRLKPAGDTLGDTRVIHFDYTLEQV